MRYNDKRWGRTNIDAALKKFANGENILCTVKNESGKLLYYTFGLSTRNNTVVLNKRIIDSGWWYVEDILPVGACKYCEGKGYIMIHGREDTPETCPHCDGTGRHKTA